MIKKLKSIPILECGLVLPNQNGDVVYDFCTCNRLSTVGDFLSSFSIKGYKNPCDIMQLKGIFDLLAFQYFDKISSEISSIFEKHFFLYIDTQPIVSIDLFARLGFTVKEREYLTSYLIKENKGIISLEPLFSYLVGLFRAIKTKQCVLPFTTEEAVVFENKLALLILLYQKSYSKGWKNKKDIAQLKMEKH